METGSLDRIAALHAAVGAIVPAGLSYLDPRRSYERWSTHADDDPVRQAGAAGHGSGQRASVGSTTLLTIPHGDDDPLDVDSFATHGLQFSDAPAGFQMFQKKDDGAP